MATENEQWSEYCKVDLTFEEVKGVKKCHPAMWETYGGKILKRIGMQLPYGVQYTYFVNEQNQLVVRVKGHQASLLDSYNNGISHLVESENDETQLMIESSKKVDSSLN